MKFQFQSLKLPRYLVVVFLLLSLAISIAGVIIYHTGKEDNKKEKHLELSTIADLKVQQLVKWRKERMGDALSIQNPLISRSIHQFLENPSTERGQDILAWMTSICNAYHYENIMLFDTQDKIRLSVNDKGRHVKLPYSVSAAQLIAAPKIYFSDLHKSDTSVDIEQDIFVPIMIPKGVETVLVGYVQILVHAEEFILPFIQTWPTPSPSAETLLVRREGNEVVFINELRHIKDSAFKLRRPLSKHTLPAAMAAQGKTGVVEGFDYRGVPVLAALRTIPDFNWFLIAKVDVEEVHAPLRRLAFIIAMISAILIGLTGISIALFWNRQQAGFYRRQLQAEEERSKLMRQMSLLLESTGEGIYGIDLKGCCTFINSAAAKMTGYDPEDLLGRNMHAMIHHHRPDGTPYPENDCPIFEAFKTGQGARVDNEVLWRRDGASFPASYSSHPIIDEGIIQGAVVVFSDISEHKAVREELQKLHRAVEDSNVMIIITDKDGTIEYVNPCFTTVSGYNRKEAMGKTPRILMSGYHSEEFFKDFWDTISSGDLWRGEFCNRKKNGDIIWQDASVSPIRNDREEITHFVAIQEDITEKKHIIEELWEAKVKAEAATRAKSEFLSNMSHELRTPLNAIIGFSQVLQKQHFGPLTEKQTDYTKNILESGKHLLALINDIIDLAKVEAGKADLKLSSMMVSDVLENSLVMIKEKALKHAIHLVLDIPDELKEIVMLADEVKTKQIMFNLLSNAVKFTPDGGEIRVSARIVDWRLSIDDLKKSEGSTEKKSTIDNQQSTIEVSVADSGIGIDPEDQEQIFEDFYQVYSQATGKIPGTGLGLPLTRRLVELQGGRIRVESDGAGRGSTFSFTLPLRLFDSEDKTVSGQLPDRRLTGTGKRPAELMLTKEQDVLDHLRSTISLNKHQNGVFTLCGFQVADRPADGRTTQLIEAIEKAKRADDVMGLLKEGNVSLLLQNADREHAGIICERIMSKIKNTVSGYDPVYTLVNFPEDGESPEVLLEKIKATI